eukprot:scaffold24367_cov73-Attheya_sp.AAC.5
MLRKDSLSQWSCSIVRAPSKPLRKDLCLHKQWLYKQWTISILINQYLGWCIFMTVCSMEQRPKATRS